MTGFFEKIDKFKPVYDVIYKVDLFICKLLLIADIPALSVLNTVLIWVALILTVVSLIDYLVKNKNVLSMQN